MPDPALRVISLPARYYTSHEHYERELDWFFRRMWVHVGREKDLSRRGDFKVVSPAGESLIIVREDEERVGAFSNVCRHRGTRLCAVDSGTFGSTIQCPYHAWTYALDGTLSAAPGMDRVEGFQREDYPLSRARLATWDGHMFIHMGDSPGSLATQLANRDALFRDWGMNELVVGNRIVYDVAANWKLIIHNYSECLHCPGVHPALQKLSHYLSGENEPAEPGVLGGRMRLRDGIGTLSMDGRLKRACLPGLEPEECRFVYFYAFLPNLLLSLHPDYVMTHTLWPRSVGRTEIVCEWLFHPRETAQDDFNPDDAVAFWDLTNRQDWHVCEEMQIGLGSRGYRPGPYSHREELLVEFDRLILAAERMAADDPHGREPYVPRHVTGPGNVGDNDR